VRSPASKKHKPGKKNIKILHSQEKKTADRKGYKQLRNTPTGHHRKTTLVQPAGTTEEKQGDTDLTVEEPRKEAKTKKRRGKIKAKAVQDHEGRKKVLGTIGFWASSEHHYRFKGLGKDHAKGKKKRSQEQKKSIQRN